MKVAKDKKIYYIQKNKDNKGLLEEKLCKPEGNRVTSFKLLCIVLQNDTIHEINFRWTIILNMRSNQ